MMLMLMFCSDERNQRKSEKNYGGQNWKRIAIGEEKYENLKEIIFSENYDMKLPDFILSN